MLRNYSEGNAGQGHAKYKRPEQHVVTIELYYENAISVSDENAISVFCLSITFKNVTP